MTKKLLHQIRRELKKIADPKKAPIMQAYMKSAMPYHGVQAVPFRQVSRKVFAGIEFEDADHWQREVLVLWRGAKFREERYAALELSNHKAARTFQAPEAMPMYEEMVVTGAWWDFIDVIGPNRVGPILKLHPKPMRALMRSWSKCDNIWKRRVSILCQLKFKGETDLDFLYTCIEPSLGSKEFFLQKAIGWALREYAWHDPSEVHRYIRAKHGKLAALSKREALKNIAKLGS